MVYSHHTAVLTRKTCLLQAPLTYTEKDIMKTSWQDYKPIFIGLGALIFLLTAIFYWASATQISGAIIGAGIVQVDESQHAVSHQQGGIVSNIFAHNGDYVKQGDVLVTLDSTTLQAELGIIEGELFETLAKEARLYSELGNETTVKVDGLLQQLLSQIPEIQERIDRQQIHLTSNVLSTNSAQQLFGKKIDQIAKQVLGTQAQLKAKQQQIQLLERDIKREEDSFKKGLIKYSLLSANKEKRAQFQGERGALVAKEAELQEKIIEHKIDIAAAHEKFRNTAIEELNKIQALKIKLLEQRKATQEELKLLTIRAPVKGRIHDSKLLGINSVVKPGTPILHIVPDNKPAFVAIRIDGHAINRRQGYQYFTGCVYGQNQEKTLLRGTP